MASQVCAINGFEQIAEINAGLGKEYCTMTHSTRASRTCNATCVDPAAVCAQYASIMPGLCSPVCWSKCSAAACQEGYERIWVGTAGCAGPCFPSTATPPSRYICIVYCLQYILFIAFKGPLIISHPRTLHPKPYTLHPKPYSLNPEP